MDKQTLRAFALCTMAGAFSGAGTRLLNTDFIAPLTMLAPFCRDAVFIVVSAAAWIAFATIFSRIVITKYTRILFAISVIATAFASVVALASNSAFVEGHAIALAFAILGSVWIDAALVLALCRLGEPRIIALSVCLSMGLSALFQTAVDVLPPLLRLVLFCLLEIACLIATQRLACQFLENVEPAPVRDLVLQQPGSFLKLTNPVFACFFTFSFLSGFALALNVIAGVPISLPLASICSFIASAALLLAAHKQTFIDLAAKVAALVSIAGILLAISIGSTPLAPWANIALGAANACFSMLLTLCMTSLCKRNPSGAPLVIAFSNLLTSMGVDLGALTGHSANAFLANYPNLASLFLSGMLITFIALCFAWISRYKFADIIFDVKPLKAIVAQDATEQEGDFFTHACNEIAAAAGLTKRESEIFIMLAKGRNGKFIEDFYTVSYNTVKTHVKHIYTKIDVHSQQELIDLVERKTSEKRSK